MNENKRTKSISRKINRNSYLSTLSSFIMLDILIFVLAVISWCYSCETATDGNFSISAKRDFTLAEKVPASYDEFSMPENTENMRSIVFPESFDNLLKNSVYQYQDSDGREHYVYAGRFLTILFSITYLVLFIQLIIIISEIISGARKIRKFLAPLDEIAFKAQVLSSTADFDAQAFDELEKAINDISPAKEGAKINTGNAEMEHLENAINALLDRMRESYRQQSRFVSDASHELRTPIAVLQGYVNMLDRWGKTDENILNESIEAIKSETEHMKKLVEQLLFLARGDSGKTKLNISRFSLNDMIHEVYEESSMIDTGHSYQLILDENISDISADPSMLKQTARILIDNASKYAPQGSTVTLKTKLTENSEPAFIIQDEGIGISEGDAPHIFERFFRSDPARSKDNGGTGLGLSIAKWIIDRHGGYFDLISRKDMGTRITVVLPRSS